jgi:hypothetical protein
MRASLKDRSLQVVAPRQDSITPSAPIIDPKVRDAFDEGCLAVFKSRVQQPLQPRDLLLRFATHYRQLRTLPRRARRSMERRWKCTLSAIALLMALGQAPALAATLQVTGQTPPAIKADGKCSLIEAIVNANRDTRPHLDCVAGSGADTILLPAQSQQVLQPQDSLPEIVSSIVVEGRGSTISRSECQSWECGYFSVATNGNLTLNETTVSGAGSTFFSGGQGVLNRGRLTLNDSHLSHLHSNGLKNIGGVVVINNSSITDNTPPYDDGGGIYNRDGGSITVTNSVIARNSVHEYYRGGGILNGHGCSLSLVNSSVSGNQVHFEGGGGGIENSGTLVMVGTTVAGNASQGGGGIANHGVATIRRSTISGNRSYGDDYEYLQYSGAGGIFNTGKLTLANSTVSGNTALSRGAGILQAAAKVGAVGQQLTIVNSTVTNNALHVLPPFRQEGGGIFVDAGALTLQRSIVSGNNATTVREIFVDAGVSVEVNDFNLFGRSGDAGVRGFTPGSTDIVPIKGTRGILIPLADNGGGTRTHALAIGSPALDTSPDDDTCPATDQRGNPRPRGPACDSGAFEGVAVMCNGRVTTMVGTINDDHLTGTAGPDVISGLTGNDNVSGLAGDDLVCAGSGADVVYGGSGRDQLFGEPGDDRLLGQGDNDTLNGGVDQDICNGGSGAGDTATACETVNTVP